jgi:hypothetical protein
VSVDAREGWFPLPLSWTPSLLGRLPGWFEIVRPVAGQPLLAGADGADGVDLPVAVAVVGERDLAPARRVGRVPRAVTAGGVGHRPHPATVGLHRVNLALVGEGYPLAVGGPVGGVAGPQDGEVRAIGAPGRYLVAVFEGYLFPSGDQEGSLGCVVGLSNTGLRPVPLTPMA